MRFVSRSDIQSLFEGKRVAIVGSGPSSVDNPEGFIDGHDVVVRVNNYKLSGGTGRRADVHYSFYGNSIRKTAEELKRDGVTLCMCKIPNADLTVHSAENPQPLDATWHRKHDKMIGLDFRPHYERRALMGFWFCDTYVPTVAEFRLPFEILGRHMPTTGFAAIFDVLFFGGWKSLYLTGFDFFRSQTHNVDEPWAGKSKNLDDPYRHDPERELGWLCANFANFNNLSVDDRLWQCILDCDARRIDDGV